MAHEGAIEGRGIRRRCASVVITLALAGAGQALAEPVFLEPGSPIYRTLAVAAGRDADCGNRGRIEGNVHANGNVKLHPRCRVVGDVSAVGHVHSHHGNVTGTVTSHAPPRSLPVIPSDAQLRALANRTYERDTTLTDATVDDVVFVRGKLRIRGSLRGTGTLIATGAIELDDAQSSTLDPNTRMSLIARGEVELGKGRKLRAVIRAGHDVELGEGAELEGIAIATEKVRIDKATVRFASLADTTPPTLSFTAPPSRVFAASSGATVQIALTFADSGSGPDPASFELTLDGTDARSGCQVTASQATCQSAPLGVGAHALASSLRDRAGNQGTASTSFELVLDSNSPRIGDLTPGDRTFVGSRRPRVAASFDESGSGVAVGSVRLSVDGVDRTGEATATATGVSWIPAADLVEGPHEVVVEARDQLGNAGTAAWSFSVDATAPTLSFANLSPRLVSVSRTIRIEVAHADSTSGIDRTSFNLSIDGVDASAGCIVGVEDTSCFSPPLATGDHQVAATVRDLAGNEASASAGLSLIVDLDAPVVELRAPLDGSLTNNANVDVQGSVLDDGEVTSVLVNGSPATLTGTGFALTVELTDGANGVLVVATDSTGKEGRASATVSLDRVPPTVEIDLPKRGQPINTELTRLEGRASDMYGIEQVTVGGLALPLADGAFATLVSLSEGDNALTVSALDRAGNPTEKSINVTRFVLPEVQITSPADLSFVAATTATVSGTAGEPGTRVSVNGVPATMAGTSFTAREVPLIEGGNTVTATAIDIHGHVATDTIHVVRDRTAPRLAIYSPANGSTLFDATVAVRGLVNDIVPGTVNASEASVSVNGIPARVVNRSFVVESVPLEEGTNQLTAVAVDSSGNRGEAAVVVERRAAAAGRILAVSGAAQTAVVGSLLPEPLIAELRNASGAPLAGRQVVFRVREGDGKLPGGKRAIAVTSDAAGRAATTFTLGSRAGAANHVVEASVVGIAGPAVFAASCTPGPPALVVVDSGGLQVGLAGRDLSRPLVAAVVDAGSNRLGGVPVVFKVVKGGGHFPNGTRELEVETDSDGRAITSFSIDSEEAVAGNIVEARLSGAQSGATAVFVSSGLTAGDPGSTSVSGVVLDNTNAPIAGVTVRVKDTVLVAVTDPQGQFRITGTPVGAIKLIVDGSTATRPGSWPDLEYDLVTIPGRDITINMPIFLLPLDLQSGVYVDETRGGSLRLTDFPGFELQIAPGSVTFPGGGRSGVVSVTVVHNDKVPMVPNFGQQPRFIVTIQPAGARFDPPAPLQLPNVDGLAPGQVVDMYSFDHDLGHFVSIGPATVSNDGTVLRSNPGVGIVKAGWHCGGLPSPTGAGHQCLGCTVCDGTQCVVGCPRSTQLEVPWALKQLPAACPPSPCACDDGDECTACETGCGHAGTCGGGVRIGIEIAAPPDNPTPADSTFDTNFSFLSSDRISATAALAPAGGNAGRITWAVRPARGRVRDEDPATRRGQRFAFRPDPPAHPAYIAGADCGNPGNGSCARSSALSYAITAQYCASSDTNTVTQDQLDIIRQEYLNHGIAVPARAGFHVPIATTNFTVGEINTTAYSVVLGTPGDLAQSVRDEFNRRVLDDQQLVPVGAAGLPVGIPIVGPGAVADLIGPVLNSAPCNTGLPGCDDHIVGNQIVAGPNGIAESVAVSRNTNVPLVLNSGWRNPERNEAVGGLIDSRHQRGNAIDLNVEAAEGLTRTQLLCILVAAADAVPGTNGFTERGGVQTPCDGSRGRVSHVHAQQ